MKAEETIIRRVALSILRHAAQRMPEDRKPWAAAMTREIDYTANDLDALQWAVGCLLTSYRERAKAMTFTQRINRVGAIAPTVMSLLAIALILAVVATGWERHSKDEGAAAHIFQLLIAGQLPFVMAYLATANWKRLMPTIRPIAFQIAALAAAFSSVAFFRL